MKKLLLIVFILLILCLAAIYIFIPATINVSSASSVSCIPKNIAMSLNEPDKWRQWWPGSAKSGDSFSYKNVGYKLTNPFTNGAAIALKAGGEEINSQIIVIPLGKDSAGVEWKTSLEAGFSPFRRMTQYVKAKEIKSGTQVILSSLLNFASKTQNIYGFPIERTTFTDTILAATRFSSDRYPSTQTIYKAIDKLKEKIKRDGAEEKDFPMLNVLQTDSSHFETMIAICTDKPIKNEADIFTSQMVPMKDRFLKTEVMGGPLAIKSAHMAIKTYMSDRYLSAPAIPFEILVTDRRSEPDTSKWKTTIFYPSM